MTASLRVLRNLAAAFGLAACVAAGSVAGSLVVASPAAAQSSSIVVEGNRRVDADTIRSYFGSGPYTAAKIDEAWKALYATGLFSDVQINQSGGRIVVRVAENEVINRVVFEGNKKIKDEVLEGEVQSKPRGPFNKTVVQADTQRIIEVYRRSGRSDVRVNPVTIDRGNGRVDLVFEIKEGDKTGIKDIKFVGNKAFSDWKLKDVISTTQTNWLSFLKSTDAYDPDRVNSDQELLRRFYLKNGYADFRIIGATAELDPAGGGYILTFTLEEGDQYRFGKVDVISNIRDLAAGSLKRVVRAQDGQIYNAELVEKSVENLTIEASKAGYAFAQVRPRGDRDFQSKLINVAFVIEEGPRVYIERIEIRGNTRTRDYVIRREFDIGEGDAYNRVLVDRAERRLRNLGYFKNVKITTEPGSAPDRVILAVDVEDQPTGEFSISGGYSTADGVIGEVSLGEKNFLGRGQYVKVSGTLGQYSQGAEFSFTEPYFLGYRLAAGFDLYWKNTETTSYTPYGTNMVGGGLRFGLPITDEITLALRYNLYQRTINLCANYGDVGTLPYSYCATSISWAIRDAAAQGATITSALGYTLSFNSLDSNQNPTQGIYAELKQDLAGVGGDVNFIRTTGDFRHYTPLPYDSVLILRAQAGYVSSWGNQDLDVLDNFYMGPNLVRGFAPSGIGPRDIAPCAASNAGTPLSYNCYNNQLNALGGTTYWGLSAEIQFPFAFLPKDIGMKGAIFADAGSLFDYGGPTKFPGVYNWDGSNFYGKPNLVNCPSIGKTWGYNNVCVYDDDAIRSSVGVSLIWQSPFGPLRFDYAWVLSQAQFDQTQAFRFSGGTRF
ncbi:outer membrane protein insertion porin family [Xanthobacter flavus]|uniref:Outer membrane protein assembly factor BamA n=1 Tax=Xanthobacter flavus TaxID=281 RepID=A0A9W6CQ22_XANFL|nr:outer membrane protein assembly factor BamA [Xanthobacter flavus]MDR6332416.1 outer membrane protein insertion porin family [Xanthobacter flavus]GLI21833.1 outer membrane protein assembly factor BamA [Xanthobacter flavus]